MIKSSLIIDSRYCFAFHKYCYWRLLCFLLAFKDVYGFIKSSFVDTLVMFSCHVASCYSVQAPVELFRLVGVWERVIEINIFKNWKSSVQVSVALD